METVLLPPLKTSEVMDESSSTEVIPTAQSSSFETTTSTVTKSLASSVSESMDESGSTVGVSSVTVGDLPSTETYSSDFEPQPTALHSVDQSQLYSSFTDIFPATNQFPMQHATQQLPSSQLSMATTDPVSSISETVMPASSVANGGATESTGATNVIDLSTDITTSVSADSGTDTLNNISTDHVISDIPSVSDTEAFDPNSATDSPSQTSGVSVTQTSSSFAQIILPSDSSHKIKPTVSSQFEVTSRNLYSTHTPRETTFTHGPELLDTVSLQTSSAAPIPEVTGKPVQPSDKGQSTILGGKLVSQSYCRQKVHMF